MAWRTFRSFSSSVTAWGFPVGMERSISSHRESLEIVRKAIEFEAPERIPYSFLHPFESDFCVMIFFIPDHVAREVITSHLPNIIHW